MDSLSQSIGLVKQYLDLRIANHSLRASNIANAETPNYRAKVPSFQTVLNRTGGQTASSKSSKSGESGKSGESSWKLEMRVQTSPERARADGNNVNLDREMAAMAENSMLYLSAIKILSREMAIAKYAITSGGR